MFDNVSNSGIIFWRRSESYAENFVVVIGGNVKKFCAGFNVFKFVSFGADFGNVRNFVELKAVKFVINVKVH